MAANHSEIIQSIQKDNILLNSFTSQLWSSLNVLLGQAFVHKWKLEISKLTEFLFYLTSNVFATQSIGEEYCHIVKCKANGEFMSKRV